MLYTLGIKSIYERYLDESPDPIKGAGGFVWLMREDVEHIISHSTDSTDWGVYGVEADWDRDTAPVVDGINRELVRSVKLVRLPEK